MFNIMNRFGFTHGGGKIKSLDITGPNPIPQRYFCAFMGFLALANAHTMRQCLSPTITQLVAPRNYTDQQIEKHEVCPADDDFHEDVANTGTREWSQAMQGFALSSFYIGYLITHIPGGILADRFGAKWVLGVGIASTAMCTLLTPICIDYGDIYGLIALRIVMGLGEGPTFPALSVLLADWVPPKERGFLGSYVMGGGLIGSIIGNTATGFMLLKYEWPVVFYVWGIFGVAWFIFYAILFYSSPQKHPCIKQKEKEFLMDVIGDMSAHRKELPPPPFKSIFKSIPMWSLIAAQIGHDWVFSIVAHYLPKYINDVLQIRIEKNGLISSLPFLVMWVCSMLSGTIADFLIESGKMSRIKVRKLMSGIASFGPAVFLVAAIYSGCNIVAFLVNLCISMGLMGTYYGGMKLTPIDMSPNYAGIVMAITNGIGSLCGSIAPITVGWMTTNTTIGEWRKVLWFAFAILNITGTIYCVWSKSDVQPWNEPAVIKKSLSNFS